MIIGVGIDIIDIRRIDKTIKKYGLRFINKCFLNSEINKSQTRKKSTESYAKRYAAKEACSKALGTGLARGVFWKDIEVVNDKFGTSSEMCQNILDDTGVALLPGSEFGFPQNKMLARLSFTDFDGANFLNKISGCKKIDRETLLKLAPNVVEGVSKLKNWSENL